MPDARPMLGACIREPALTHEPTQMLGAISRDARSLSQGEQGVLFFLQHNFEFGGPRCVSVTWKLQPFALAQQPADTATPAWYGTLLANKEDGTGLQFRRNRYVDPMTGRFTQEDPLGLAGGLNLYGFASGDPVNFADPFGLCPFWKGEGDDCDLVQLAANWAARNGNTKFLNVIAGAGALLGAVDEMLEGGGCEGTQYACGSGPNVFPAGRAVSALNPAAAAAAGQLTSTTKLAMQLASEEALSAAQAGRGISIAGAGARSGKQIDDIARLLRTYGGEVADWAKRSVGRTVNGVKVEVHWYENMRTGQRVEFKTPYDH
jgi:RHS repeat-associated protein